jgi:hypothetical protein
MKKLCAIIFAVILTANAFAQAPSKMSYQAVIRNSSNQLVSNHAVSMKISILQGSVAGTSVYTETQTPSTNANGLVSIEIGGSAGFNAINWEDGPYFIKTETDPSGGTSYTIIGTNQILSVPYALHSKTAETLSAGITETDPIFVASPAHEISSTNVTNWNAAFSWGNHANAGYLKSYTETDPVFGASSAKGITSTNITNWNTAYGWGNHAGLYRPINYVPAWSDITSNPFVFSGLVNNQLLKYNSTSMKWENWTPNFLTGFTETDPYWTAASANYYTKSNMQTSGASQLHFNNLTNKPITVSGYGILDAMTTAHAANGITSTNIANWNTAYGWGNHAGLYRPISYVPAWGDITSNPFVFSVLANNQLLKYNSTSMKWENWTPNFLTGFTETDPYWTAASANYYTKSNMQTSGTSQLHFNNLTNKPTTVSGYGISDAMTTSHAANGITSTNITNWNTAYGWGNHAGLYRPISYVPAWSEITSNPFVFSALANNQLLKYNSSSMKWENWTPDFLTGFNETDPHWSAAIGNYYTTANMQTSGASQLHFNNLTNTPTTVAGYGITDAHDNWGTQAVVADATLSGNGSAATPLKIAQQSATSGQVLKWSGSTWVPADDAIGGLILPYSGSATSGGPLFNIVNLGSSGAISTLSNGNYAIWGESASSSGIGVYGVNKTSTGTTYGVFGDVYSTTGYSGYFQGGRFFIQGNTGIGTQNPSAKLEINGQVKVTGGSPGTGKVLTSDAAGLASWQTPELSPWLKNASNLYYNSGNVGVGLTNPAGMLEIYGNSVDTYPTLFLSEANGYARIAFRTMLASSKHWVLAGHTNLTDGVSQWHLNYFDGSAGKNIFSVYGDSRIAFDGNVGIGTQSPSAKLEVAGQVKITGGSPDDGKVLISDASGLASWQSPEQYPWLKNGSNIYYNSGNVAIGMTFPRYNLTIYNDNSPLIGFYNSTSGTTGTDGFTIGTGSSGSPVWIWNWENSNIHFGTNNTNRMIINADGHVSMMGYLDLNTNGIFKALSVAGKQALWWDGTYFSWGYDGEYNYFADKVTIGNAANPGYMLYVQGSAYATGSWSSSDARFKKNITPIENALEKIMKIRGTSFEFRQDEFKDYQFANGPQFGFIAQELEDVLHEVVNTDSNGYKSVNYSEIIPVLTEAVKEQQKTIVKLGAENDRLKMENAQINARLDHLENIIETRAMK